MHWNTAVHSISIEPESQNDPTLAYFSKMVLATWCSTKTTWKWSTGRATSWNCFHCFQLGWAFESMPPDPKCWKLLKHQASTLSQGGYFVYLDSFAVAGMFAVLHLLSSPKRSKATKMNGSVTFLKLSTSKPAAMRTHFNWSAKLQWDALAVVENNWW